MSEGLDLLRSAFPEQLDSGSMSAGDRDSMWITSEVATKISKLPVFSSTELAVDLDGVSVVGQWIRASEPKVRNAIQPHNIAWYQPYRFYGAKKWGIYFHLSKMMDYCEDVWSELNGTRRDFRKADVVNLLWQQVARHELEHAVHELGLAKAVTEKNASAYQFPKRGESGFNMEGLSTHFEFYDYPTQVGKSQVRNHGWISEIASSMPLPEGYCEWDSIDVEAVESLLASKLGSVSPETFSEMRNRTEGKVQSKFIRIPLYLVEDIDRPFESEGIWARAYGFDCKKVQKALDKEKVRRQISPFLGIRPGDSHILVLNMANRPGTVPVSCHGLDQVHTDLLKQISTLADVPKAKIQEVLRRNI